MYDLTRSSDMALGYHQQQPPEDVCEMVRGKTKKQTQRPTMKWMFFVFRGVRKLSFLRGDLQEMGSSLRSKIPSQKRSQPLTTPPPEPCTPDYYMHLYAHIHMYGRYNIHPDKHGYEGSALSVKDASEGIL